MAATNDVVRLLLLLTASAAADSPTGDEFGYCGGWWPDRLRVLVLG